LAAAAVLFALALLGLLPFTYAAPVIGVVLALGSPPDYLGQARPVARRTRNVVVGVALIAALAVVVWQPQLTLPLVVLFGMDGSGLVVTVVAVIALALPLAMTDATSDELSAGWFLLTRRNLMLSLTILVSVGTWYGALGHSFIPIAVFVLVLPMLIGFSRLLAARKGRLEYGLLREPLRPGLGPHRLQLVNVGERVREGQRIARAGNSGNTSAPHIHIQTQTLPTALGDIKTIDLPQMLRTLHTYPLLFRDASVIRDGVETLPSAADPRRGDVIRPTKRAR
jgi:hypothetical protein